MDLWVRIDGVVRWCDLTVSEPGVRSALAASSVRAGSAAKAAEARKLSKWTPRAPANVVVEPLAMETTGRVGEAMQKFLRFAQESSSGEVSCAMLVVQLSVTMAKLNVALLQEAGRKACDIQPRSGRRC